MSLGAGQVVAMSMIVSAEVNCGSSAWIAAAKGSEAALVLRKVRRLSMAPLLPMLLAKWRKT
jgi:hypothetical protein